MPAITKDDYTDKCIDDVKRNDDGEYKLIERQYNDNKINDVDFLTTAEAG